MCGIAGFINLRGNPADPRQVSRMNDVLQHRGPDGDGVWTEGPVGLGHRRLAIIDMTSAGDQPMISSNGRFVLTYNGEVYNFRELRRELENLGVQFNSTSDSEVVLESLAMWGPQVLPRFNGMFALALWDRWENCLLLARDRYGTKPLYWSIDNEHFKFASENKAILRIDSRKRDLDLAALTEYLTFQNYFSDRTLLSGVHLFPPGHTAILDLTSVHPRLVFKQFWDFNFREPAEQISNSEYVEELRRLLQQAIHRQLVSDVEIGTFLSGGIDSGSIAAIASRAITDLKSFTCGFDLSSASGLELAFDERRTAEALSSLFKTEHYEMVLKAGDMERCMERLVWHLEEPRVGQSYPNFYAHNLAGRFVKVVLGGTGGDELFGGYPWRYFLSHGDNQADDFQNNYFSFWNRLLSQDEMTKLLITNQATDLLARTRELFLDMIDLEASKNETGVGRLNSALYLESKTFLHGLLIVDDKLSMAHGVENRVPFLDNDLVDFATSCPAHLKVRFATGDLTQSRAGFGVEPNSNRAGNEVGKWILREAARDFLPANVVDATKQGFSAPDSSWFRGESMSFVERRLLRADSRISEVFDQSTVRDLVNSHLSGRQNRRLLIWSLLSLESWLEEFL